MQNHFQCLRTRTRKAIVNHDDCIERYDLVNDPNESTNLVEGNSAIGVRPQPHPAATDRGEVAAVAREHSDKDRPDA